MGLAVAKGVKSGLRAVRSAALAATLKRRIVYGSGHVPAICLVSAKG